MQSENDKIEFKVNQEQNLKTIINLFSKQSQEMLKSIQTMITKGIDILI